MGNRNVEVVLTLNSHQRKTGKTNMLVVQRKLYSGYFEHLDALLIQL